VKIELLQLPCDGADFTGQEDAAILELAGDPHLRLEGPVRYDLFAQVVGRELLVRGRLDVPAAPRCARCGAFFSTSVRLLSFLRSYALSEGVESVDLTEDIREDLLLGLPNFPLCSPDCKGLCPRCGRDLNRGPCGCPAAPPDRRWAALGGLKLP